MQNVIQGTTSDSQKIHEKQSAAAASALAPSAAASVHYESGKTSSTPQSSNSSPTISETEISELQPRFITDFWESENKIFKMDCFVIDKVELDEDHPESSKFLSTSEDTKRSVDLETQDRLQALFAFIGKLSLDDGKDLVDHKVFQHLTSSVPCGLDEAAAALTRMHIDNPRTPNEKRSLVETCTDGDFGTIRKLLTEGQSIHETTEEGESILSLACSARYYELAQVLLAMNVNVENRGIKKDCTPLMEAASAGHVDIVNLLIAHGADVNAQSTSGNTPLMYGCTGGHDEVVRVLLEAGANVEDRNENGHTPLMEAASAGHCLVAKILLEYGAGINTHSNEFKESALTLACYKGHLEMVRFLLEAGADQEHKTDEMHTALMEASMDGHVEVARLLLDSGAQVNMPTDSFESPLTLAACGGHVDLAMLLIERGANIEEVNDEGYTPLMEAAREGHEEMVALLLSQGANINAQTEEAQETALTLACCGGFLEVADFLIKAGADIELGASTPLMEAAQEGHLDLVQYLLESAADVHAQTQTGNTALTYACENGHTDVADLLLQFGADLEHESEGGRTPLMKACRAGHLCTVQFLISKRADVNRQTTNNDHTPLSLACAGGHLAVVELLLAQSANPFHKLKDNSTMLIEATKGGHTAVVQLLLDYPHSIMMNVPHSATFAPMLLPQRQQQQQQQQHISHQQHVPHPQQTFTHLQHQQQQTTEHQTQNLQLKHNTQKSLLRKNRSVTMMPDMNFISAEAQQIRSQSAGELAAITKDNTNILGKGSGGFTILSEPNIILSPTPTASTQGINITESQKKTREEQILHRHQIFEELERVERELHIKGAGHLFSGPRSSIVNQSQQQDPSETEALLPGVLNIDLLDPEVREYKKNACAFLSAAQKSKTVCINEKVLKFEDNQHLPLDDAFEVGRYTTNQVPPAPFSCMDVDSETDSNRDTALTLACAGGHEELVELLLLRKAAIEHRDKKGFTPLILAATAGHQKVVDILLNHGADIEAQSERTKDTPLSLACSGGRYEVVEHLLNRGANKEHRNVSDYTPLSLAASNGYVNIIKLLLNHGAEINSRTGSKLGISPLMLAAMNGHTAAVKLLLDMSCDINAQIETNRNTALTLACFQGRHEIVSLLLDRKANVEHRAKTGLTPLMEAASGGYVEVGRVLLSKGADVNATPVPSSRDTALTIAADKGHCRFVELLLTRGIQVEVKNKKGNSPLWLAANGGHLGVVDLLYHAGADIDSQDNRKVSCLMAAFRKGHIKVVKWMMNHVTQFPSDQEMTRYIATVSDKELLKKCQECMKVIRAAKETQAAKANKNATILLEELDMEKTRRIKKGSRCAKTGKKEKKEAREGGET